MDARTSMFQPRQASFTSRIKEKFNADVPAVSHPEALYNALCREQKNVADLLFHRRRSGANLINLEQAVMLHGLSSPTVEISPFFRDQVTKLPLASLASTFAGFAVEQAKVAAVYQQYAGLYEQLITSRAAPDVDEFFCLLLKSDELNEARQAKAYDMVLMLDLLVEMGAVKSLQMLFHRLTEEQKALLLASNASQFFYSAVNYGQPEIIELLLDLGLNPNNFCKSIIGVVSPLLATTLHMLANTLNNVNRTLRELRVDSYFPSPEDQQHASLQLHCWLNTMLNSYEKIFIILLNHDADPDLVCSDGSINESSLVDIFYPEADTPCQLARMYEDAMQVLPELTISEKEKSAAIFQLVSVDIKLEEQQGESVVLRF